MLCALIFIQEWRLRTTIFLRNFFMAESAERKSLKKNFFVIFLMAWSWNPGFTSNKPTHYLLDYGDFIIIIKQYVREVYFAVIICLLNAQFVHLLFILTLFLLCTIQNQQRSKGKWVNIKWFCNLMKTLTCNRILAYAKVWWNQNSDEGLMARSEIIQKLWKTWKDVFDRVSTCALNPRWYGIGIVYTLVGTMSAQSYINILSTNLPATEEISE